ncbi:putative voltage-gated ClC-type chloride channel ClcB [Klebsiella pneumoniae]|uniref:voltage-gated ClC-type chloride channel ClcB n=1 Tax=Klebsiella pneumoniae TaxID=573 RepID=UPI000E2B1D14|nr:voltage-gated ClC-type chloride channel ClcB [Klebsiella pneumoniae]SVT00042.1 putative voltage-gated ClC-type chloride channel ClcB [Klebsiella pneumoniae]
MGNGWHEWPLVLFTVLGQCVVGATIVSGLGWLALGDQREARRRLVRNMFFIWLLMGIGFLASVMHLGSPLRAFNSLNRIGASALSNEIASGALFFAVGGFWWLLAASLFARRFTPQSEWKLWVACGAAAGMASAYHAPLAGSLFIAEILFGTLMLASLGPVVISAVIALLLTQFLNGGAAPLYHVVLQQNLSALHYGLMLATGLLAGLCGPLFIWLMDYSHRGFVKLKLAPPWQLALGGLIVGGLSLITPAVWGNGYSVVQSYLLLPPSGALLVGVFICKLLAVLASSGSGAPGGVFTPTLFVGLAMGMLFACVSRLWLPGSEEMAIMMGLTGMAAFLAATTHAPIMSTLMICEMTGQYTLLPGLLITCVVSSVLSRTLRRDSIYRHHVAEHV